MTKKLISVYNSTLYWDRISAEEAIKELQFLIATKGEGKVILKIEGNPYDDNYHLASFYIREETDEEYVRRLDYEAASRSAAEKYEREQYERLRSKFG